MQLYTECSYKLRRGLYTVQKADMQWGALVQVPDS